MREILITELVDKVNGYFYGIAGYNGEVSARLLFNEVIDDGKTVIFQQVNQDDSSIILNQEEIDSSIEEKSEDGMGCYKVYMKSGSIITIVAFDEKGGEAQACHLLYGSYDDYIKKLDLNELEEKIKKTKKIFVFVSGWSSYMQNTYEHICLEDMDITDGTRKLTLYNGRCDEKSDKITFTLYSDAVNDIWLMGGADGWDGLKLRLYNQPFTEVKMSLLYK